MEHPVKNLMEPSKSFALKDKDSFDFQINWGSAVYFVNKTWYKWSIMYLFCMCIIGNL